jgi:SAM-dependent methyltransferase
VRQIVNALSREFFGQSLPLQHFPRRMDIVGCGLSDNPLYADALINYFNYRNTFYHQAPYLDITAVAEEWAGTFDFVIASDVFEHITFPVDRAFNGLRTLLKPTGFAIFSVPYLPIPATDERYPELHNFHICHDEHGAVLMNTTRDGRQQEFRNLAFHGGDGQVLEMRLFAEQDLFDQFAKAGLSAKRLPRFVPRFGILDFSAHSHLFILRPSAA